jgi:hypothetical protein
MQARVERARGPQRFDNIAARYRMRVYKFLSSEFAMKDIRERRIKISEISDLNDPFELIPCDLSEPGHLKAILEMRDELTRNRGLLRFSRAWANPLLWAHYADKHRGICPGFDLNAGDDIARAVDYVEDRLPWEEPPTEDFTLKLLWSKFAGWKYEDEVRAFMTREEEESRRYFIHFGDKLKLQEIIVGHRCCIERGEISAATASYPEPVPIIKARLARATFNVEENPFGFMN